MPKNVGLIFMTPILRCTFRSNIRRLVSVLHFYSHSYPVIHSRPMKSFVRNIQMRAYLVIPGHEYSIPLLEHSPFSECLGGL